VKYCVGIPDKISPVRNVLEFVVYGALIEVRLDRAISGYCCGSDLSTVAILVDNTQYDVASGLIDRSS